MPPDSPLDPAIEAKVRASFDAQEAMRTVGARMLALGPGRAEIELPALPHVGQQAGFVHGGVVAMILDSACGYASLTTMPAESEVVTVEFKINFLRPALGERILARGAVTRAGRSLTVAQGEAFALREEREDLVAIMIATMIPFTPR
jgi:uncharacterized protein (TIGR00369 family)